jgi:hypothetical protein
MAKGITGMVRVGEAKPVHPGEFIGEFYRKGKHTEIYKSGVMWAIYTDNVLVQNIGNNELVSWVCNTMHEVSYNVDDCLKQITEYYETVGVEDASHFYVRDCLIRLVVVHHKV